jgi:S1-C subfamily serine protease
VARASWDPISEVITRAAAQVGPSVVQIRASGPAGQGSGFVWDAAGDLLTNAHVVQGVDRVEVAFPDGRVRPGRVVGRDLGYDLAVVRVEGEAPLVPVAFGDSDALEPGVAVIAVGNPFGLRWTVTFGVVGGLERVLPGFDGLPLDGLVQTDAAINPGNSGGPLACLDGRVVGITTAAVPGAQGLGFAIPANAALAVAAELRATGRARHPWLGIEGQAEVVPEAWVRLLGLEADRGVLVTGLVAGAPAERAGLRPWDLIVAVDGQPVATPSALRRALARGGRSVRVRVLRAGEPLEVPVMVEERPRAAR